LNSDGESSWIEPLALYGGDPASNAHVYYEESDVKIENRPEAGDCAAISAFPLHDDRRVLALPPR